MTDSTVRPLPLANHPKLTGVISALGIAQIISWGSFYYTIAVLGESMQRDLGVSQTWLFATFTLSLLLSGLAAPTAGRLIDEHGGRHIMSLGSCVGTVALLLFATAGGAWSLVAASILAGITMAATLYDAAFAALNQIAAASYRRAVTALTLFGGFASTVFWPLSQLLLELVGWRYTLAIYAGMQLLICLPLHWHYLPGRQTIGLQTDNTPLDPAAAAATRTGRAGYLWLATAFALVSFVSSALLIHLISLLKSAGLSAQDAVFVAALIGPLQFTSRLLELILGPRIRPVMVGTVSFVLMVLAVVILYFVQGFTPLAFLFAACLGFSNGMITIVRGTVPAALFGREGYGALLGKLARPAFIARALAPAVFAAALTAGMVRGDAILSLVACAALAMLAYQIAIARALRSM